MRTARLLVAVAALALAGCGATGGGDRPELDATLLLDAPPAAVHAGTASAVARGYDGAEGVHLERRRATARTAAVTALTNGRADFAVLDLHGLAGHRDLVAVMAIVQRPLLTVTTTPSAALPP